MPASATAPGPLAAFEIASKRGVLPTSLGSAEIRGIGKDVRRNAVFSARTTHALYVSRIKEVCEAVLAGEMDEAEARVVLMEMLRAIGYTPEGGFPSSSDKNVAAPPVPPAFAGTLQDLGSFRRLSLIIDTQVGLMRGAAQKAIGTEPGALKQFPFWEFARLYDRAEPRDWRARVNIVLDNLDRPQLAAGEPLIFAKDDEEFWTALGSSDLFDDALDVDHAPFAFGSGWGWRAKRGSEVPESVIERDAARRGKEPSGEEVPSAKGKQEGKQPLPSKPAEAGAPSYVPVPRASTKGIDMDLLQQLRSELDAEEDAKGVLTMKGRVPKGGAR